MALLVIPLIFILEQSTFMYCNGNDVVTTPGAIILSPNYPANYEDFCNSQLTITFANKIFLRFESFDTEKSGDFCQLDWLEIRDGDTSEHNLIGSRICGSDTPNLITSTGNSLTLIFRSDDSVSHKGFKLKAELGTIWEEYL